MLPVWNIRTSLERLMPIGLEHHLHGRTNGRLLVWPQAQLECANTTSVAGPRRRYLLPFMSTPGASVSM